MPCLLWPFSPVPFLLEPSLPVPFSPWPLSPEPFSPSPFCPFSSGCAPSPVRFGCFRLGRFGRRQADSVWLARFLALLARIGDRVVVVLLFLGCTGGFRLLGLFLAVLRHFQVFLHLAFRHRVDDVNPQLGRAGNVGDRLAVVLGLQPIGDGLFRAEVIIPQRPLVRRFELLIVSFAVDRGPVYRRAVLLNVEVDIPQGEIRIPRFDAQRQHGIGRQIRGRSWDRGE